MRVPTTGASFKICNACTGHTSYLDVPYLLRVPCPALSVACPLQPCDHPPCAAPEHRAVRRRLCQPVQQAAGMPRPQLRALGAGAGRCAPGAGCVGATQVWSAAYVGTCMQRSTPTCLAGVHETGVIAGPAPCLQQHSCSLQAICTHFRASSCRRHQWRRQRGRLQCLGAALRVREPDPGEGGDCLHRAWLFGGAVAHVQR